ncbi:MAG: hypothetical protein JNK23_10545 [Opitutaceae bacterium]|nr:hypothetical protein [Opitutaceae bacterium]
MPHTTTSLIAFKAPTVKGVDRICLPLLTRSGEWSELELSLGLARDLAVALAAAARGDAPAAATAPAPRADGRGAVIDPAVRLGYLRAWAEHRAGLHRTFAAACRALGVKQASATDWLNNHRAHLAAECAAAGLRVPLLKPKGSLA